jgi:hypothetical protein
MARELSWYWRFLTEAVADIGGDTQGDLVCDEQQNKERWRS